jgi:isopenicillin-N N-acyltransferase-like protein
VGVCLNILRSIDDAHIPALPIHVLLRLVLQAERLDDTVTLLCELELAASSCISIADVSGQAISAELAPVGMSVLEPDAGLLIHTNHCLGELTRDREKPLDPTSSSLPRYQRARQLLQPYQAQITPATLMQALRDEEGAPLCICRSPDLSLNVADQRETIAAVVLDLDERIMHLAPGRPSTVDFVPISLEPVHIHS